MNSPIIPGKFITLEGIEGVGKTTHLAFIADYLKKAGLTCQLTREPGGTPFAEKIREVLLGHYEEKTWPETELLLLNAGRVQHIRNFIQPTLAQGQWVISDRFADATWAYQGGGRQASKNIIQNLHECVVGDFKPDLTLLLDCPPEVALTRIKHRKLDRIEQETQAFFTRVREVYLALAKQEARRFKIIDASLSLTQVQTQITVVLETYLKSFSL